MYMGCFLFSVTSSNQPTGVVVAPSSDPRLHHSQQSASGGSITETQQRGWGLPQCHPEGSHCLCVSPIVHVHFLLISDVMSYIFLQSLFVWTLQANKYGKKLYVMDARPKINAYANIVSYFHCNWYICSTWSLSKSSVWGK